MKIIIGSDHAGFELKASVKEQLRDHEITDVGPTIKDFVDYPDIALMVARDIGNYDVGILICGTGIGMSISANRIKGVRAAVCYDVETARLSRAHNNANILCLGARTMDLKFVPQILDTFLKTPFEGDRHLRRIKKIDSNS